MSATRDLFTMSRAALFAFPLLVAAHISHGFMFTAFVTPGPSSRAERSKGKAYKERVVLRPVLARRGLQNIAAHRCATLSSMAQACHCLQVLEAKPVTFSCV